MEELSYLFIQGLEIRNYMTTLRNSVLMDIYMRIISYSI